MEEAPYRLLWIPLGFLGAHLLVKWLAPDAEGHGTDKVIEAVHRRSGRIPLLVAPVKLLATVLTIAATLIVAGTVTNGADAVADVSIVATDPSGVVVGTASTGNDGSYTLTTLAPGSYSIAAFAAGYRSPAAASVAVPAGGLTAISFTIIPVSLVDPPETGEGEDTAASTNGLAAILYPDPGPFAATYHPSVTFICRDGKVLTDQKGYDAALAALKLWQDAYDATAPARNKLAQTLADADSHKAELRKNLTSVRAKLSEIAGFAGPVVNHLPPAILKKLPPGFESKLKKGFPIADRLLANLLKDVDTIEADLDKFQKQSADGKDRAAASAALAEFLTLTQRISNIVIAVGRGSILSSIPKTSINLGFFDLDATIADIQRDAEDAANAAGELQKSVQDLKFFNYLGIVVQAAKENFEQVRKEVQAKRLKMKNDPKLCPCETKTTSGHFSQNIGPRSQWVSIPGSASSDGNGEGSLPSCKKCDEPNQPIGPPATGQPPPPNSPPTSTTVAALHARGFHVICYIEVGAAARLLRAGIRWSPDGKRLKRRRLPKGAAMCAADDRVRTTGLDRFQSSGTGCRFDRLHFTLA
jgi:hypothetical protein